MKCFGLSNLLLYFGFICLILLEESVGRKRAGRQRRHNHLDWSAWTEWSSCTAQCGTGAAYRERKCIDRRLRDYSNKCHGKRDQFKICNTQDCRPGQDTLREQLCSKHNNDIVGGRRYRWEPYLLHSARCELTCKASGRGFYNSFPDLIVNGTTCRKDGSSVCVEGVCKKFGCDGIVGSKAEKDGCGVCDGDGTSCRMVKDVFEEDPPVYGYNLVTLIPSGATSINVTQLRESRNYLALRYKTGKYIINGRRRLLSSGQYKAAGTTFTYKNRASKHCPGECIYADGPTNEDLEIMLLYFGRNTGVLYSFGYPIDTNGILKYQDLPYTDNSLKINGNENENRRTDSYTNNGYDIQSNRLQQNGQRHDRNHGGNRNRDRYSNYDRSYNPDYYSVVLGENGDKQRENVNKDNNHNVYVNTDRYSGTRQTNGYSYNNMDTNGRDDRNWYSNGNRDTNGRDDRNRYSNGNRQNDRQSNNDRQRPDQRTPPNRALPPTHRLDASVVIGDNEIQQPQGRPGEDKREKSYYISSLHGSNGIPSVNSNKMPAYTQSFPFMNKMKDKMHNSGILGNGQNDPMYKGNGALGDNGRAPIVISEPINPNNVAAVYNWKVTGYTKCNKTCGSGVQYPIVKCTSTSREIPDKYCDRLPRPDEAARDCNTHSCPSSWEASAWSPCSVTCDEGIQIRNISCLKEVSDSLFLETALEDCAHLSSPNTSRSCKVRDCFTWAIGAWSECSTPCGPGVRVRTINCTSPGGRYVSDYYCNSTTMPVDEEECYRSCKDVYSSVWYHTQWEEQCPVTCGEGKQKRRVVCLSENPYGPDCEESTKPKEDKDCRAAKRCHGYWFSGPWQQCNASCGEGMRNREVVCLRRNGDTAYEVIPDMYCDSGDRPTDIEPCQSEPCPPEWFMTEWGECSVTCGKGERTREVLCIDTYFREDDSCNISSKPSSIEECGTTPCSYYTREEPESGDEESDDEDTSSSSEETDTEDCEDNYPSCDLVVKLGMCSHSGYRAVCCRTCSSQT